MKFNNNVLMSAMKFLCGETNNICRLCLCSTESKEICIQDDVTVKGSYHNETLSFSAMFCALGLPTEPLLPQVLCSTCASTTINCYLFKKLCIYSQQEWQNSLKMLDTSLSQNLAINSSPLSVYFIISNKDNIILTSRKRFTVKSKRAALAKVKESVKNRLKYLESKQKITDTVCDKCGERFESSFLLSRHIKYHNKTRLPCTKCAKVFATSLQLDEHVKRIHYPKKIKCDKCIKKFSTAQFLKIHQQLHHVSVSCKMCSIQFTSRKELRAHLNKHNVNSCPKCNKKINNKNTFKLHIRSCGQNDKTPKFICDICNKGYLRKNGVRSHLKIDHGFGNVLSCDWCNKKFDAVSRLNNHIVKHTRERRFTCELCGGKFVTQAALVYHRRLHTGERPFPCDMCNESFLSASRRIEHKRRKHLGPTLECNICHVKFITGHQLRKHRQRHLDPHSKLFVSLK